LSKVLPLKQGGKGATNIAADFRVDFRIAVT